MTPCCGHSSKGSWILDAAISAALLAILACFYQNTLCEKAEAEMHRQTVDWKLADHIRNSGPETSKRPAWALRKIRRKR